MISSSKQAELEEKLRQFERDTSNQIVVVTFPSLEGGALEDFSIRLADAWKIGQKGKNNGVILLIFKNDRKVRIEVGYGLEGVLTDAASKLIIENEIVPRFREGKFDEGIERAVDAIMAATKGEYYSESKTPGIKGLKGKDIMPLLFTFLLGCFFIGPLFGLAIFIVSISIAIYAFFIGEYLWSLYCFVCGLISYVVYFFFSRALKRVFGSKMVLSRDGSVYTKRGDWSSGFGGGGFGGGGFGGGGGGFGGGGASGSW